MISGLRAAALAVALAVVCRDK